MKTLITNAYVLDMLGDEPDIKKSDILIEDNIIIKMERDLSDEVADEKTPDGASQKEEEKIIQIEGEKIEKYLRPDDHIIALCIEGKQISKEELKKTLNRMQEQSSGRMVFLIGGSLGLWDKLIKKAELKLSFSKMTFPHQLMRVMLTEVICQL